VIHYTYDRTNHLPEIADRPESRAGLVLVVRLRAFPGQPFCDGSHKGTGLGPKKVEITEAKTVAWCACKHSQNAPFCDGTHAEL